MTTLLGALGWALVGPAAGLVIALWVQLGRARREADDYLYELASIRRLAADPWPTAEDHGVTTVDLVAAALAFRDAMVDQLTASLDAAEGRLEEIEHRLTEDRECLAGGASVWGVAPLVVSLAREMGMEWYTERHFYVQIIARVEKFGESPREAAASLVAVTVRGIVRRRRLAKSSPEPGASVAGCAE